MSLFSFGCVVVVGLGACHLSSLRSPASRRLRTLVRRITITTHRDSHGTGERLRQEVRRIERGLGTCETGGMDSVSV